MRRVAALAALAALVAGCSGSSSAPSGEPQSPANPSPETSSATPAVADWPGYHGDAARTGDADVAPLAAPLRRAWSVHTDAAIYAQPIVVGGAVIAATENNTVYAVDARTGSLRWRRHLAAPARRADLPCGNIDPSGITGTPAYDAAAQLVFVVTEDRAVRHQLVALDPRTGAVRWTRGLDVVSGRDRHAEQQRGALLVAFGHVYVPFGGRYGDCGNYVGYLAAVRTDGSGAVTTYAVPTAREAGMWAPPGPVIGPGGNIYVASGNGAEVGGRYDGSDSVIALTASLQRTAVFAPSTWRADNAQDLDLGSMSPAAIGDRLVIAGKRGTVYLLRPSLGGIGGQLSTLSGCPAYGGAAVQSDVVLLPCNGGIRALRVTSGAMHWLWRNSALAGTPVIARTAGYAFDGGTLVEFDIRGGAIRARVHVGDETRFTTAVPTSDRVIVATRSGIVAISGR